MSLIKCRECGKEISNKAAACPHCGHKEYKPGGCMVVFLAAAGLVFVASMFSGYKSPTGSSYVPSSQPNQFDPEATARGMCMLQIKAALHDPDSAEFEHSSTTTVQRSGDIWIVLRPVRAKNAYNAMRKTVFECRYRLNGQTFELLGIRDINK